MKQRKTVLAALLAAALLPWLTVSAKAADTDVMFSDPGAVVGNSVTVNVYTTAVVLFIGAAVLGTLLIRSITRPVRKVKR